MRALKPASIGEIPEVRLRKLRAYSQAALAPMLKHVEDDFLRPEELVVILTTAALFVQMKHVMRTDKLPLGQKVEELFEGTDAVELPVPEYYQTQESPGEAGRGGGRKKKRGV